MGKGRKPPPPPPALPPVWQVIGWAAGFAVLNTVFPSVGRAVFWASRLSRRGLVLYLAWRVAFQWVLVEYAQPWAARKAAEFEARRAEVASGLARDLGREPTDEEIEQALIRELEAS